MVKECETQMNDPDWIVSKEELYDLVSVGKISESRFEQAFNSASELWFFRLSKGRRLLTNIIIMFTYSVIILAYAYAEFQSSERSK
jgi:hypothetical protein